MGHASVSEASVLRRSESMGKPRECGRRTSDVLRQETRALHGGRQRKQIDRGAAVKHLKVVMTKPEAHQSKRRRQRQVGNRYDQNKVRQAQDHRKRASPIRVASSSHCRAQDATQE